MNNKQVILVLMIFLFLTYLLHMLTSLLLGHTDSTSTTSSSLSMLTSHTESPVMTQTTMSLHLPQTLQIVTEFLLKSIGGDLAKRTTRNVTGFTTTMVVLLSCSNYIQISGGKIFQLQK